MNKKSLLGGVLLLNLFAATLLSCSDNNENNSIKPAVDLKGLGSGHDSPNDRIAYIGGEAFLEAEIAAVEFIRQIEVKVTPKAGNYTLNKVYTDTKYVGEKNTVFREYFDIPSDAVAGEYRLRITVTDLSGQSASAEADLTLKPVPVSIQGLTFGAGSDFPDNKIGYIGTAPMIGATSIKAENGIDKIYVMLQSVDGDPQYQTDTTFTYNGETELTAFCEHISILNDAPAGDNYRLHFKVTDMEGKHLEQTMYIQIKETGITVSDLEIGLDGSGSASASNIHIAFGVNATDPLKSIRVRVYKADAATIYFVDETLTEDFAAGDKTESWYHKHLNAGNAIPGEYVMEIMINDNKGAYLLLTEQLTIIA